MNKHIRFNAYRIMRLIVYFDLPTENKIDRKIYTIFRKNLLKSGFKMFQFSIYIRHCMSLEIAEKYKKGIKNILPEQGHIIISMVIDKQFGDMEVYHGSNKRQKVPSMPELEFF